MFSRKKMQTTNFPSSCVWSGDGTYTAQRLHNKNYSHGRRQAEKTNILKCLVLENIFLQYLKAISINKLLNFPLK